MPLAARKKILIVDDAVVVRKTISDAINSDPALEVAAVAANGRIGVEKFSSLKPDAILLDVEMPEMDGLEAVRAIRKIDAHVPIIMFSTLTDRGASTTLEALSLGATDYVTKPSNVDLVATGDIILRELIPKIRALCHVPDAHGAAAPGAYPATATTLAPPLMRPCSSSLPSVLAIGVSTGGPDALVRLMPSLPAKFPIPVVIAQHMPPIFTAQLASRLSAKSALPVRECVSGEALAAGCVLIAPGDFHMVVSQENGVARIRTHQGPKENFCRPSVDVLFRSIASVYGGRTLAVVLTGMGQDGLKGCEMLHALGARIFVQDESTSVVWGMPGFVARAGLAEKILPIDQLGGEIVRAATPLLAGRSPA